jgi:hypothetical protein
MVQWFMTFSFGDAAPRWTPEQRRGSMPFGIAPTPATSGEETFDVEGTLFPP